MNISTLPENTSYNWQTFIYGSFVGAFAFACFQAIVSRHLFTQKNVLGVLTKIPGVKLIANHELNKEIDKLRHSIYSRRLPAISFPSRGMTHEQIMSRFDEMEKIGLNGIDFDKLSGTKYHNNVVVRNLDIAISERTLGSNPNHSDLYHHINAMGAEILKWCAQIFKGGYGTITSGGTESNVLAVRVYFRLKNSSQPNIVLPTSAHVSFHKTAMEFGIKLRLIDLNPDHTVNITKMRDAIDENTIMLVGSYPSYPAGVIDDIPALANLAAEKKVPLHVDACLGGFVAAFIPGNECLGFDTAGITSISADFHKYGLTTSKGASVVLFKTPELRRLHYYLNPDWAGGFMFSQRLAGSFPGEPIAKTWGTMLLHGSEGYCSNAHAIVKLASAIRTRVTHGIPELQIMGDSKLMVIGFVSRDEIALPIQKVSSEMHKRKWNLNSLPNGFHLCITMTHVNFPNFENVFFRDLQACVEEVKLNPKLKATGTAEAYCLAEGVPDSMFAEVGAAYLDILSSTPDS